MADLVGIGWQRDDTDVEPVYGVDSDGRRIGAVAIMVSANKMMVAGGALPGSDEDTSDGDEVDEDTFDSDDDNDEVRAESDDDSDDGDGEQVDDDGEHDDEDDDDEELTGDSDGEPEEASEGVGDSGGATNSTVVFDFDPDASEWNAGPTMAKSR